MKNNRSVGLPELSVLEKNNNLVTSYSWGWYAFSLVIPFAGVFVAVILYDQDSKEVRRVGRNCLLIGFSFWVVLPVIIILGLILTGILAATSFISDAMPPLN